MGNAYLGASCAFHTAEAEVVPGSLQILQVFEQVLYPQTCALADGCQLRRLQVSVSQAGKALVLFGKG